MDTTCILLSPRHRRDGECFQRRMCANHQHDNPLEEEEKNAGRMGEGKRQTRERWHITKGRKGTSMSLFWKFGFVAWGISIGLTPPAKTPPVCWKVFLSQQHTRNFAHGAVCNIWFSLVEAWTTPASTPVANDRPRALNPPTIRDRSQPLSPIKAEHKKKED